MHTRNDDPDLTLAIARDDIERPLYVLLQNRYAALQARVQAALPSPDETGGSMPPSGAEQGEPFEGPIR